MRRKMNSYLVFQDTSMNNVVAFRVNMQFSAFWLLLTIQSLKVKSEAQTVNFPSQHELCAPRYQKNHILKVGQNVTEFFEKIKTFLTAKNQCIMESRSECQYLVKGKLSYAKKQCLSDGGNVFSPTTKELTDLSNMPDFKNKTFVFKFKIGRVNNSAVRFAYSSDADDPEALPVNLNVGSQNLNYAPVKFGFITTFRLDQNTEVDGIICSNSNQSNSRILEENRQEREDLVNEIIAKKLQISKLIEKIERNISNPSTPSASNCLPVFLSVSDSLPKMSDFLHSGLAAIHQTINKPAINNIFEQFRTLSRTLESGKNEGLSCQVPFSFQNLFKYLNVSKANQLILGLSITLFLTVMGCGCCCACTIILTKTAKRYVSMYSTSTNPNLFLAQELQRLN